MLVQNVHIVFLSANWQISVFLSPLTAWKSLQNLRNLSQEDPFQPQQILDRIHQGDPDVIMCQTDKRPRIPL